MTTRKELAQSIADDCIEAASDLLKAERILKRAIESMKKDKQPDYEYESLTHAIGAARLACVTVVGQAGVWEGYADNR